jgi:hypothetical protein
MIDDMTRDECIAALDEAFGGNVTASTELWVFRIDSKPPRVISFSEDFVARNVVQGKLSKTEFQSLLKNIPPSHWVKDKEGVLRCVFASRFNPP